MTFPPPPSTPYDRLTLLFEHQLELQRRIGGDPRAYDRLAAIEYIKMNVLALTDELHEALQEVGWKPWATSRHLNRPEYVGELIDAFHFLINLFLAVGATPEEVYEAYVSKIKRNHKRQDDGYTGMKDAQGRELDRT